MVSVVLDAYKYIASGTPTPTEVGTPILINLSQPKANTPIQYSYIFSQIYIQKYGDLESYHGLPKVIQYTCDTKLGEGVELNMPRHKVQSDRDLDLWKYIAEDIHQWLSSPFEDVEVEELQQEHCTCQIQFPG